MKSFTTPIFGMIIDENNDLCYMNQFSIDYVSTTNKIIVKEKIYDRDGQNYFFNIIEIPF